MGGATRDDGDDDDDDPLVRWPLVLLARICVLWLDADREEASMEFALARHLLRCFSYLIAFL